MTVAVPFDPSVRLRPLRRREYHRLVPDLEGERVELIEGVLVAMPAMNDPHASAVVLLNRWLARGLPEHLVVRAQLPLAVSEHSEPEPDIAVVDFATYTGDHPSTAHLVMEVAGSSLRLDMDVKARLYAAAGVPAYWVVDLAAREVVVHEQPKGGRYRRLTRHGGGETLVAVEVAIALDELLPPASS